MRDLKARGVPIDGVGFQMHVNLKGVPAGSASQPAALRGLGLEVAVTEADVALPLPPSAAARARAGAACSRTPCAAAWPSRRAGSFTFWGFTDSRSWIPDDSPGYGAADAPGRQAARQARLRGGAAGPAAIIEPMAYRYLFEQMVRRELRQKYKGSALGVLWYVINPLVLMGAYYLMFGVVFKLAPPRTTTRCS